MSRPYDYVVFGATGFTGAFVIEELSLAAGNRTWAVAARNEQKLNETLLKVSKWTGKDLSGTPKIIADVNDSESLNEMAKKTKVVINVVGPYRFYGEPVVKACLENGTHHVDISGEPIYLEGMQLRYNEVARNNKAFAVGACGFDSIPCELGIEMAKKQMIGDTNHAETVVEFIAGSKGGSINFGTFQSMIYGFANRNELPPIRRKLFSERLPKGPFKPPKRNPLFFCEEVNGWCLPFMGSDKSVAYRTQMYNYTERKQRPIQVNTYFKRPTLLSALAVAVWGILFAIMASFKFTRSLLEKYPEIFTFGAFSKEGATREQLEDMGFTYWIFAKGWKTALGDLNEQHPSAPDTSVAVKVSGPDPGYKATAIFAVTCARTFLEEPYNLPEENGGVVTPGAVFQNTRLIERLQERGIKFEVVDTKNKSE